MLEAFVTDFPWAVFVIFFLIFAASMFVGAGYYKAMRIAGDYNDWRWKENLPGELNSAELYLSEQDIHMTDPVALHGRPDQVFEMSGGQLIVVDSKVRSRHRAYEDDRIQLSVYATILRYGYGRSVANYGFVRTVVHEDRGGQTVQYHRVTLLSSGKIISQAKGGDL